MNTGSSLFMLVGATLFLVAFGLPLLLCPMAWARRIGWTLPQEKDLANYLGRSLGGVVMAVIIMATIATSIIPSLLNIAPLSSPSVSSLRPYGHASLSSSPLLGPANARWFRCF